MRGAEVMERSREQENLMLEIDDFSAIIEACEARGRGRGLAALIARMRARQARKLIARLWALVEPD